MKLANVNSLAELYKIKEAFFVCVCLCVLHLFLFPNMSRWSCREGLSVLLCPGFHRSPLLSPLQRIIAVWLASTSTLGWFRKPHLLSPSASRRSAGLWKVLRALASGAQIHGCVYRILTNSFLLPGLSGCLADCEHYI